MNRKTVCQVSMLMCKMCQTKIKHRKKKLMEKPNKECQRKSVDKFEIK